MCFTILVLHNPIAHKYEISYIIFFPVLHIVDETTLRLLLFQN